MKVSACGILLAHLAAVAAFAPAAFADGAIGDAIMGRSQPPWNQRYAQPAPDPGQAAPSPPSWRQFPMNTPETPQAEAPQVVPATPPSLPPGPAAQSSAASGDDTAATLRRLLGGL